MDNLNLCQLKEIIKQNNLIIKIYSNLNKNININLIKLLNPKIQNQSINLNHSKKLILMAMKTLNNKTLRSQQKYIIHEIKTDTDSYLDDIQINYTSSDDSVSLDKSMNKPPQNMTRPTHSLRGLGDNKLMNRMMGEAKFREEIFTDNIMKPFVEKQNKENKQITLGKINLF
jgi:hypothetical protein